MDCMKETEKAEAEKWRNVIVGMVQEIYNPEYLRRIYFFLKGEI